MAEVKVAPPRFGGLTIYLVKSSDAQICHYSVNILTPTPRKIAPCAEFYGGPAGGDRVFSKSGSRFPGHIATGGGGHAGHQRGVESFLRAVTEGSPNTTRAIKCCGAVFFGCTPPQMYRWPVVVVMCVCDRRFNSITTENWQCRTMSLRKRIIQSHCTTAASASTTAIAAAR